MATSINNTSSKILNINNRFCDKIDYSQPRYALFSFINKNEQEMGIFLDKLKKYKKELPEYVVQEIEELENKKPAIIGIGKIRGVFYDEKEASEKAEEIVRNTDSTNSIFTCMIGVPFPLVSEGYAQDVQEVNLQQETEKTISLNVREKRKKEQREIEEIRKREEALKADVQKTGEEVLEDDYITHRVKLAHLRHNIEAHEQKLVECIKLEKACVEWLLKEKEKHPEFEENYVKKYMDARKEANIPKEYNTTGFMKFLLDPILKKTN